MSSVVATMRADASSALGATAESGSRRGSTSPLGPRLAIVTGALEPERDGVADYSVRLAGALADAGTRPIVISPRVRPHLPESRRERDSVLWRGVVRDWSLRELTRLGRRLRAAGIDVVHVQFAPLSYGTDRRVRWLPVGLALGGWRGRLVVTLHEYSALAIDGPRSVRARARDLPQRLGVWDPESGCLGPAADAIVVTNEAHREALAGSLPAARDRVRLIPLAPNVDVAPAPSVEGRRELLRALGVRPEDRLVAFFGFIHPVKGLEHLVRAVAQLAACEPRLRLLVIGGSESLALDGSDASTYKASLERVAADVGVSERVRFTGHVDDVTASKMLQLADVAALPITYGASMKSGSLLTMLAHGLPVVATVADRPAPALVDGENVLLVPPRDADALANAIGRLLEDAALREKLRAGALELASARTWDAVACAHLQLYEEIRRGRRVGRMPAPAS